MKKVLSFKKGQKFDYDTILSELPLIEIKKNYGINFPIMYNSDVEIIIKYGDKK